MKSTHSVLTLGLCGGLWLSSCKQTSDPPQDSTAEPTGAATEGRNAAAPAAAAEQPSETASICDRVPAATVEATLGLAGMKSSGTRTEGTVSLCEYRSTGNYVSVRVEQRFSPSRFDELKKTFSSVEDVAGLGDRAFSTRMGKETVSVTALKGETLVTVSTPVELDKTTALTKQVVLKL